MHTPFFLSCNFYWTRAPSIVVPGRGILSTLSFWHHRHSFRESTSNRSGRFRHRVLAQSTVVPYLSPRRHPRSIGVVRRPPRLRSDATIAIVADASYISYQEGKHVLALCFNAQLFGDDCTHIVTTRFRLDMLMMSVRQARRLVLCTCTHATTQTLGEPPGRVV